MQFLQPFRLDLRRRPHQQVLGLLVHRKRDDLADVGLVGEQHDDAVDAGRRSAVRRRPVAKRLEQAAELLLNHLRFVAGDPERLDHDVGAVVPNRPRRQLDAVTHDVVLPGQDRERVLGLERLHAALRHRERVVAELDPAGVLVDLVHRVIDDPAEAEFALGVELKLGADFHPCRGGEGVEDLRHPTDEERRVAVNQAQIVA